MMLIYLAGIFTCYSGYEGFSLISASKAKIGLAISKDSLSFKKLNRLILDPEEFNAGREIFSTAFGFDSYFYMAFCN